MSSSHSVAEKNYSPFPPEDDALAGCETPGEIETVIEEAAKTPDPEPSSCHYNGGMFRASVAGLVYIANERVIQVCSELRVMAETRNNDGEAWGLWLRWCDRDGNTHDWYMPRELLYGDAADVPRELASRGLTIANDRLLRAYLQQCRTTLRARCVQSLGWHGSAFVMPNGTIGECWPERIVFQPLTPEQPKYGAAGSWQEWRESVAVPIAGNSRLVLAISTAFAGPLLELAGEDSGGLHLVGASSSGKTTALRLAASVYGQPNEFVCSWRSTTNGLEGLATNHNDGLLCLDELSQMDPRQAGEAAYMLANAKGKARASRTGSVRPAAKWRLLFLSSGEQRLSDLVAEAGKRVKPGQEIRLVDIPVDAGVGMGIVETPNGQPSASVFIESLRSASSRFYGAVGLEWLRQVVAYDRAWLVECITDGIRQFVDEAMPKRAGAQVSRVAQRFGLVAVAGELATRFHLTGWQQGEAIGSVLTCFRAWLREFGVGNREDAALRAQVRAFLETHGASRFQKMETEEQTVYNRVGFWRLSADGSHEYLVLSEAFRTEVVKGYEVRHACAVLANAGMLRRDKDRSAHKLRLPGFAGTQRVHVLVLAGTEVEE